MRATSPARRGHAIIAAMAPVTAEKAMRAAQKTDAFASQSGHALHGQSAHAPIPKPEPALTPSTAEMIVTSQVKNGPVITAVTAAVTAAKVA